MTRIDHNLWNDVESFFRTNVLMSGEEKTLSEDEIGELNQTLKTVSTSIERLDEIVNVARNRWQEQNK